MLLGDYFGNIYELDANDAGDDYIPYPGESDQPIKSMWETPYMMFGVSYEAKKSIVEWVVHGRSLEEVEYNTDITIIEKEYPYKRELQTITQQAGKGLTAKWGAVKWGEFTWGPNLEKAFHKLIIKPRGWGNAFGIKHWFWSKRLVDSEYESNGIWVYAFSGRIERGAER